MPLLIQHDRAAHDVLVGLAVAAVACEVAATYFGQARSGERRLVGSVAEALFLRSFGDDYRDYERRRARLIPGVW
jgi:protein-S-isoprenylcysteine O-methyltransferase Ste14